MITLKTLADATPQEVFDQVKNHLLTQNEQSISFTLTYKSCMYKVDELKCAAGCLIADDEYQDNFEGQAWGGLVKRKIAPNKHLILISQLQSIHDTSAPILWEGKLKELAETFKLKYE